MAATASPFALIPARRGTDVGGCGAIPAPERMIEIGQVAEAGLTMDEIVESVKRVTHIMGEITSASEEQTAEIEHINEAVTQMDEATQQNLTLVEQASAAAEELRDQADNLRQVVSIFVLDGVNALAKGSELHLKQARPAFNPMLGQEQLQLSASSNQY